jgi:sugar lactone lactonase YvrE
MRKRTSALLVAATVTAAFAMFHPSVSAQAAGLPPPLPLPGFADIAVNGEHVFISGGPQSSEIVVTDLAGTVVARIAGQGGASGLALNRDGSTLYAALTGAGAVAAIDTGTLAERARYATGTCPVHLAVTDRVWFGYGCAGQRDNGIGSIDVTATAPIVRLNLHADVSYGRPPVLAAARDADLLSAGDEGSTPSAVHSYAQTADGALRTLASGARGTVGENLEDLAVTPDGTKVYTASGFPSEIHAFALGDLTPRGQLVTGAYPQAVTVSPDGGLMASGSEGVLGSTVYLFETRDGSRRPAIALDHDVSLQRDGLAWSPDNRTVFAVTVGRRDKALRLHTLPAPAPTAARPAAQPPGQRPAAAAPLPLPAVRDIKATDRYVFVSGGPFANEIVVTDHAGTVVRKIPGQAGALELALSRDGRTLYAVLQASGTISAIDTDTLQERARYVTSSCPRFLAVTDRVWFGHACDAGWFGGIGRIDVTANPPAVTLNHEVQKYYVAPRLFAPQTANVLAAVVTEGGPNALDMYVQNANGTLAKKVTANLNVASAALSPNGATLYVAAGGLEAYAASDLSRRRRFGGNASSAALTVAGDRIAGGSNTDAGPVVDVFRTSDGTRQASLPLGAGRAVPWGGGVAWSRDGRTLFAVTLAASDGSAPALHILTP